MATIKVATIKEILPRRKEPSLKKVAAYCRVSTQAQDQLDSLAAQEQYHEERIKANPQLAVCGALFRCGQRNYYQGTETIECFNIRMQARQS